MSSVNNLISFHIIEYDNNNQILMTWTYPTISNANKTFILSKLSLRFKNKQSFSYFRASTDWLYALISEINQTDKLKHAKMFAIVLISKDFNPEKYAHLGKALSKCYCKTGTPVELVKLYLSVYVYGVCSTQENGMFNLRDFDNHNLSNVKEFIHLFGAEIILLYTAMLLKRRVIVYHHSEKVLLKWLPSISKLMSDRDPISYLLPIMELNNEDLAELKNNTYFIAGFTDNAIFSKQTLYDLLVNLSEPEMTVTPEATDTLIMTRTHKDIASFLVQLAENNQMSEEQIIKEIVKKTNELINYLRSLGTTNSPVITRDDLKSKNLNPNVELFLWNLAKAENMTNI